MSLHQKLGFKMKECEVCGRSIRTGRKYCHEHRGYTNNYTTKKDKFLPHIIFAGFLLMIIAFFLTNLFNNIFDKIGISHNLGYKILIYLTCLIIPLAILFFGFYKYRNNNRFTKMKEN